MSASEPIRTLAGEATFELVEKRSRFLVRAVPVTTPAEALDRLAELSDPEATHNCWAYRVGTQYRFSDDGEPGGTAGRPILGAIEGQGLDNVLVVVIRHFGGVKLGAGGLVRAYGGAAAACLHRADTREQWPVERVQVAVGYGDVAAVQAVLARAEGVAGSEADYTDDGARFTVAVETRHRAALQGLLGDATRGRARFSPVA